MNYIGTRMWRTITRRNVLATLFILVGIGIMLFFGIRAFNSYRHIEFMREQAKQTTDPDSDTLRSWMSIRYISVVYLVPEAYLFEYLGIASNERDSNETIWHLNKKYNKYRDTDVPLIQHIATAIEAYRANPMPPGLDTIEPWMTIRYISRMTGVPTAYILQSLGVDNTTDTIGSPLGHVARILHYRGGSDALAIAIHNALHSYEDVEKEAQ